MNAKSLIIGGVIAALLFGATPAAAQLNGENLLGDNGIKSGTQAHPGFYAGHLYYRYRTDTIRDANGNRVTFDPNQRGSQTINAMVPLVMYVSKAKLFGANVGMMAVLPVANGALEAPAFGLSEAASTGLSDAYLVPLQLGWHTSRADVIAGFGVFTPNGRYDIDATDNLGKGMWSYEVSAGTTLYLDRDRKYSLATTAYWETHTKKKDTAGMTIEHHPSTGITVGQALTLEGGFGRSFFGGAAHIGTAYYAQWKLTADDLGVPGAPPLPRHRVFAIGPDITIPIATRTKLVSLINVRYLIERGTQLKTEGHTLVVTTTFPIPGITIPHR